MTDTTAPLAETPAAETIDLTTKIEAPGVADVTTPEPKSETTETETVDLETQEPDGEPKKKIPGSQRLKNRLRLIESEHLETARERDELRAELEKVRGQPQGKPGVDREPTEADYPNDWLAYQEAKTAWTVRQTIREENARLRQADKATEQTRAQRELNAERYEALEENQALARERIPDFDKVVAAAASINVKPEVAEELLASEKPALLQYYLAKNPDKVRELNGMSGRELAREIGRLESRVHLPTAKKATEAAPPPTEVKGGASPQPDPRTGPDDMNEYVKWRRKQQASA